MKRYLTLVTSLVLFGAISAAFMWAMMDERDYVLIAPTVLFGLFVAVLFVCLVRELLIGHNEYEIENCYLHIKRKGRVFTSVSKEDVERLVVICDLFTNEKEALVITAGEKKYYVKLTKENRGMLIGFADGIPYEAKKNAWYYVVSFFAH